MMKHTQSYIICATPRSGSTLLCDLLTDTKVAGRPDSFFRRESMHWWADYLDVPAAQWSGEYEFDQSYLAAIQRYGTAGTAVFGMRLMWESLGDLQNGLGLLYPGLPSDSARFQSAFGSPLYIHLSRQDKIAQAVSRLKAEQSGLWHIASDGSERERLKPGHEPAYDTQDLSKLLVEYEQHDTDWQSWFAQQDIQPVRITYEALSTEPQAALAIILSALALDPGIAATVEPRTAKLADDESRRWAARFRTERRNPQT